MKMFRCSLLGRKTRNGGSLACSSQRYISRAGVAASPRRCLRRVVSSSWCRILSLSLSEPNPAEGVVISLVQPKLKAHLPEAATNRPSPRRSWPIAVVSFISILSSTHSHVLPLPLGTHVDGRLHTRKKIESLLACRVELIL